MPIMRRPRHPYWRSRPLKLQLRLAGPEWELLEDEARREGLATAAFARNAALAFTVAERARRGELHALDRRIAGLGD